MRSPAAALLVCVLAGAACSPGDPESRAVAGSDPPATASTTTIAAPTAEVPTAPAPTTVAAGSSPPTAQTGVSVESSPPPAPTETATVAVPIDTTELTSPPPVEDLDDGEHIGIVVSSDNGTIEFDRVDVIDGNGDGVVDGYQNQNPRQRSVPMPDHVLFDGQVVDSDVATSRLGGLTVLVRLTILGQRLAAIDLLTVPI